MKISWFAMFLSIVPVSYALSRPVTSQSSTSEPVRMQLNVVHEVAPEYSEEAKQAHIQGVVIVSVTVGPDGRVVAAETVSGHPLFLKPAIDAVRQWTFEIPMVDGKRVTAITRVSVDFRLDSGNPTVLSQPTGSPAGVFHVGGGVSAPTTFQGGRISVGGPKAFDVQGNVLSTLQRCSGCSMVFSGGTPAIRMAAFASFPETSGYRGPGGLPGVAFRLARNGTDLEVTCGFEECRIDSKFADGTVAVQSIVKDHSAVLSSSAQITVTYKD